MILQNLTGRIARCGCGRGEPSVNHKDLAFFEYRGPGSRYEGFCEACGRTKSAHDYPHVKEMCGGYSPRVGGLDTDSYYCGHKGWD